MGCPCCEERWDDDEDDVVFEPGHNFAGDTAGAVVYPSAGGPGYADRQRHATLAKRRGAATKTVVTGLPLRDYITALPMPPAERGPITFREDSPLPGADGAITAAGGLCAPIDIDWGKQ